MEPINAKQVKEALTNSKLNAGGMDGLLPAEAALFSDQVCEWMATLLNLVEEGAEWPTGQNKGRDLPPRLGSMFGHVGGEALFGESISTKPGANIGRHQQWQCDKKS